MTTNRVPLPPNARAEVIYAPHPIPSSDQAISRKSLFLSGSSPTNPSQILWQSRLASSLASLPINILDPYRPDWDSTWVQDISFAPFKQQVTWELDMLESADVVAVYLDPESKAPISLFELGLSIRAGKAIVACPEGYWRRGNVQVVTERFGIEFVDNLDDLATRVIQRFRELGVLAQ